MKTIALAAVVLVCALDAAAQEVVVRDAPEGFSYTIEEVYFKHPHTYKRTAAKIEKAMTGVKVTIRGEGFREMDEGPLVWLNGTLADFSRASRDGRVIESYFYRPVRELRRERAWELIYARTDTSPRLRIKLNGDIRRLTDAEWRHAVELGKEYGVEVVPTPE